MSSPSSPIGHWARRRGSFPEQRIGAVLICDAFRPVVGILSERDIIRALASRGATALEEPVSRSMTGRS